MIAGSSGRIAARTARDHALRPLSPDLRLGHDGHDGHDGMGWARPGGGSPAAAGERPLRPLPPRRPLPPPCPPRTILASSEPPENGQAAFLEFLALAYNRDT
jgi:hypothetical protein